jgi:hypothetical protein
MIGGQSQRRSFNGVNLFPVLNTYIEPLGDFCDLGRLSLDCWGLVNFRTLNLESKFWSSLSLGSFFGQNSFVFSVTPPGLALLALNLFRADLGLDFCSDARFKLGALANLGFGPLPAFFFCLYSRLSFSLPARILFGAQAGCFLSLPASFLISATLGLCFRQPTSLFSRESLGFLLRAASSLFFGLPTRFLFGLTSLFGFRAHLSFDFRAQARFFFCTAQRLGFGLAARILFGATTLGIFRQPLRVFGGSQARGFTRLHALDLFFYRPESHFGTTA